MQVGAFYYRSNLSIDIAVWTVIYTEVSCSVPEKEHGSSIQHWPSYIGLRKISRSRWDGNVPPYFLEQTPGGLNNINWRNSIDFFYVET